MTTTQTDAQKQGRAQLESIVGMMTALSLGKQWDGQDAETAIEDSPLCIEVRQGWHIPGGDSADTEYCITLCTGGPAVRVIGDLDHGDPTTAILQCQDWGTPWTRVSGITDDETVVLLAYARQLYYGD